MIMKLFKALPLVIAGIALCAVWSCREKEPVGHGSTGFDPQLEEASTLAETSFVID